MHSSRWWMTIARGAPLPDRDRPSEFVAEVGSTDELLTFVDKFAADCLARLDPDEPFPVSELGAPRGRQGSPRERVVLPEGWLDDSEGSSLRLTEDASETTGG